MGMPIIDNPNVKRVINIVSEDDFWMNDYNLIPKQYFKVEHHQDGSRGLSQLETVNLTLKDGDTEILTHYDYFFNPQDYVENGVESDSTYLADKFVAQAADAAKSKTRLKAFLDRFRSTPDELSIDVDLINLKNNDEEYDLKGLKDYKGQA